MPLYEIKKVKVVSIAKYVALISTIGYVVWGVLAVFLLVLTSSYARRNFFDFDFYLGDFTLISMLIGLVLCVAISFGLGALIAWLYNVFAGWIGGIEMEITLGDVDSENEDEGSESTHTNPSSVE